VYVVSQYRKQIGQFLCSTSSAAFSRAWVALVLGLTAFAAVFCFMGAPAMNGRPWDVPILLDVAWRIAHGQVPHRDFYSAVGDLPFYVTWLGMKVSRPCMSAITYGNVFVMVFLGVAMMAVLRRRTGAFYAAAMSLFVALLAVTPRPLGDSYDYTDYAMLYNRYGEAFVALFAAIIFIPPVPEAGRGLVAWIETAFAGAILAVLFFCKLNYFVLGLGFCAVACLFGRLGPGRALLCLSSAAACFGAMLAATHIPAASVLHDEMTMMAGQGEILRDRLHSLVAHGVRGLIYLPVIGLLVWEMAGKQDAHDALLKQIWRPALVMMSLWAGAVLLITTNCQLDQMPLLALAGLYGAEMIRRGTTGMEEDPFLAVTRNLGAFVLFAVLLVPIFANDCKTVMFAFGNTLKHKCVSTATLESTQLSDFRFLKDGTRSAEMRVYMDGLDENLQMLRRHTDIIRLSSFVYANPSHIALGLTPAEGGVVGFLDTTFTQQRHPPLKMLLGNATHILVDGNGRGLQHIYGVEWDNLHLTEIDRVGNVVLLKLPDGRPTTAVEKQQ
jgi:hypothetical protein